MIGFIRLILRMMLAKMVQDPNAGKLDALASRTREHRRAGWMTEI